MATAKPTNKTKPKTKTTKAETPPVSRRDVRIDTVLLVQELSKFIAEPLQEALKERHQPSTKEPAIVLTADIAEGRVYLTETSSIDPDKFLKLYDTGKLKRADLVACLTIKKGPAEKLVDPKTLKRFEVPGSVQVKLSIGRRKGTTFELEAALAAAQEAAKLAQAKEACNQSAQPQA